MKEANGTGQVHFVPASIQGKYIIRFTVTATSTNAEDINRDWKIIQQAASKILSPLDNLSPQERRNKMKNLQDDFRMSLVLSNTPHSPCFINGSFAAILPLNNSHIYAVTHELSQRALKNSLLPISTRRRTKNFPPHAAISKQMSVDGWMNSGESMNKYLVPAATTPTNPQSISRQGSLDSRIEEILESNNMESTNNKSTHDFLLNSANGHSDTNNATVPKIVKE